MLNYFFFFCIGKTLNTDLAMKMVSEKSEKLAAKELANPLANLWSDDDDMQEEGGATGFSGTDGNKEKPSNLESSSSSNED